MEQSSNFLKDIYDPRFTILDQFLAPGGRHSHHITKLLNLPFCFYEKQTLTAPFFTIINLPASNHQDRIGYRQMRPQVLKPKNERKDKYDGPIVCLGNNHFHLEEPLLFECSNASLNLELTAQESLKPTIRSSRKLVRRKKYIQKNNISAMNPEDKLTVFTFTGLEGENSSLGKSDSLTLLSTSSSASSTREYYLPADTGSTDTIKVAEALGHEDKIYSSRISEISSRASNETWYQQNSRYPNVKRQTGQTNVQRPGGSNNELYKNMLYTPELINKKQDLNINSDVDERNPLQTKYQETKQKSGSNNQLSVIVRKRESNIPFITIDKLYDKVLVHMKINEVNQDSDPFLKSRVKLKEIHNSGRNQNYTVIPEIKPKQVDANRPHPSARMPSPQDWVKEIKENKFTLQQDIIENESLNLSAQSSQSMLCSGNKKIINNRIKPAQIENEIFSTSGHDVPKNLGSSNTNIKTEYANTNLINKINAQNYENKREPNITIHDSKYDEKHVDPTKTGIKLLSNGTAISFPRHSGNKLLDNDDTSSKYKKLTGFFDLGSQKPVITKLFIPSDVVVEGSGSGLEDEMDEAHITRRKIRPFPRPLQREKIPPEEYGEREYFQVNANQLNESPIGKVIVTPSKQYNKEEEEIDKNSTNSPEDAYVYSESLFTNKNYFQKLCERFDLKNKTYISKRVYGPDNVNLKTDIYEEEQSLPRNKTIEKLNTEIVTEINPVAQTDFKNSSTEYTIDKGLTPESVIENNRVVQTDITHLNVAVEPKTNITKEGKNEEYVVQSISKEEEEAHKVSNEEVTKLKEGRLESKNGQPALLYDESGFPYTDLKGRLLKNNIGIPVLNVKSYNDIIINNITVYDANKISVHDYGFEPSTKPLITTIAKVTDQVGNPASLYNNLGLPLTDEDGLLLHDSNGEILVTLDSRFFPLCCKNGTCIYLRNGLTWLSQRYKYIVTTKNKVNSEVRAEIQTKSLGDFGSCNKKKLETNHVSFPFINTPSKTNESNFIINSLLEKKSVSTQYENRESKNFSRLNETTNNSYENFLINVEKSEKPKSTAAEVIMNLLYNKLLQKKTQTSNINNQEINLNTTNSYCRIFDVEGNCLTDKYGYPLYNKYGEPLILYDKYGIPISDSFGGPIFNSQGEQIVRKSNYIGNNKRTVESHPSQEKKYLLPERPYCEQPEESITESMIAGDFENSLTSCHESEPLLKIIERNDIRAWDLHNEVPSSVKSVYSLPSKNYTLVAPQLKSARYIQHNNYKSSNPRQNESADLQGYYLNETRKKIGSYETPQLYYEEYAPLKENDYNQYDSESVYDYEDANNYAVKNNVRYIHVAPKKSSTSYYVKDTYYPKNTPYYTEY